MKTVDVYVPALGRSLAARPGTSDERVIADCFTGGYHLPGEPLDPANVLDLGANCGATAAHYRHLWPRALVVAIEMDADNYRMLELNSPGSNVCAAVVLPARCTTR